jgi:hypothetical protein
MRSFRGFVLAALIGLLGSAARADEAVPLAELKKRAEANWETVGAEKFASAETRHFLIYAPAEMSKQLKDVGSLLEKFHDTARDALKFPLKDDDKGEVLPGRVTVYLFSSRDYFTAFVRRIEKRRLDPEETGSFGAADADLHIAVSPPRSRQGLPVEVQAGERVASLLLQRRAGRKTPLPDWVASGIGRATYYRVAPRDRAVLADRAAAARLSRMRSAEDIWDGKVSGEEAATLYGSLADFLAYGPGSRSFPTFVAGFAPEENVERKTVWQALDAARLKPDVVSRGWKAWVVSVR